jgi:hypothetical protein
MEGATKESIARSALLREPRFGYLGTKDQLLLEAAVAFRCEAFLTMERCLRVARHTSSVREMGIRVLTPVTHWQMLRPWAALWR